MKVFRRGGGINEDEILSTLCNCFGDLLGMLKSYIAYFPRNFEYGIGDNKLQLMHNDSEERDTVDRVCDIV